MKKIISLTFFCIVILCLTVGVNHCRSLSRERNRLWANQIALLDTMHTYRTVAGRRAASVERLQLTVSEIKRHNTYLAGVADELRIKIKRIQSAATVGVRTEYQIKTVLHDSIVVRDSLRVDTVRCMVYCDPWLSFSACENDDSTFDTRIQSHDTLTIIAHRVPRKFLFIKWGCKAVRLDILSKNRHARITHAEYIELKKRASPKVRH